MKLFATSDFAVYPTQGVVQVVDIGPQDIAGSTQVFYDLKATSDGTRVLVPAKTLERSGLRRLIGRQEVALVMATLRAPSPSKRPPSYKWHQQLMQKVSSGTILAIAEVLRDLRHVKNQRELSATERHILDTVQHHLVAELVIVTGRTVLGIERELARIFRPRA